MEVAQGALLGLVVQNRLEITNCFPFPKNDEIMEEEEYQLAVMRRLRRYITIKYILIIIFNGHGISLET